MRPIDVRIIRVRRPDTIASVPVGQLVIRAALAAEYPGTTPERLYMELKLRIEAPELGCFVGFDGGPKALALAHLPTSQLMIAPQVSLIYSEERNLLRHLGEKVKAWVMESGYDRIIGLNLRHTDRSFCRGLSHVGKCQVIGSLIECRL